MELERWFDRPFLSILDRRNRVRFAWSTKRRSRISSVRQSSSRKLKPVRSGLGGIRSNHSWRRIDYKCRSFAAEQKSIWGNVLWKAEIENSSAIARNSFSLQTKCFAPIWQEASQLQGKRRSEKIQNRLNTWSKITIFNWLQKLSAKHNI